MFNHVTARDIRRTAYIKRLIKYGITASIAFKCAIRLCP